MFQLSQQQFLALRRGTYDVFVDRVLQHVREHFPNHWRLLGPQALRPVVDLARLRAQRHGFESQRQVCQYLNLMLLLGSYFDEDPLFPWAAQTLCTHPGERSGRLDRVYDRALQFLELSAGRSNQHLLAALRRVQAHANGTWTPSTGVGFGFMVLSVLQWVFPQRAAAVGETTLRRFADEAARRAAAQGVVSQSEAMLHVGLGFMLGSGFDRDPQFPWAALAGQTPRAGTSASREQQLRQAAVSNLALWLQDA